MDYRHAFANSAEITFYDHRTSLWRDTERDIDESGLPRFVGEVTRTKARGQAEPPPRPLTTRPTFRGPIL